MTDRCLKLKFQRLLKTFFIGPQPFNLMRHPYYLAFKMDPILYYLFSDATTASILLNP
jgi:hypothetical protein